MSWKFIALGSRLRGDDAVALHVADLIMGYEIIKAEGVPENHVSVGDKIVLIDAVDFGGEPGSVRVFGYNEVSHKLASTHNMSAALGEVASEIKVVGIQPKDTGVGEELTRELTRKLPEIAEEVRKKLGEII